MDNQNPEAMKDAMYMAIRGVTFVEHFRTRGKAISFPSKLLYLLTHYPDDISWDIGGTSFTIRNKHRILNILHHLESNRQPVAPRTLTRRLERHNFQRVTEVDTDTWFHELFRRDRLRLNVDVILNPGAEDNAEEGLPAVEEHVNRDQQIGDNAPPQLANNIQLIEPHPFPGVSDHGGVLLEENQDRDHFDVDNNTRNRVQHEQHFQMHQPNEALLARNYSEQALVNNRSLVDEVVDEVIEGSATLQQLRTEMSVAIPQLDRNQLNHLHHNLAPRLRQCQEGEEEIIRYFLQLIEDTLTSNSS